MSRALVGFIEADWPAPAGVRAGTTTRSGGASSGAFSSLNLGAHVGDEPAAVAENRQRLRTQLGLQTEIGWLNQVHGVAVLRAPFAGVPQADGVWTERPGTACAVLTADCLPILLCDDRGERVAALHAGWRGLQRGIVESGIRALAVAPERLLAWLGPAIGPAAFEVGEEVRAAFVAADERCAPAFARSACAGRWYADLYALARARLARAGVSRVYGGGACTYSEPESFYSYRRERTCGRMASLIWLEGEAPRASAAAG